MTRIFIISGLLFLGTISLGNAKCPYSACQASKLDYQRADDIHIKATPIDIPHFSK